jgi:L-ascorbate metabolism protein UlaG (beta-lactamase superfamily)
VALTITHFGHACLLVELDGARILFDPGTDSSGYETLTALDAVLITHDHPDHLDTSTIDALIAANPGAQLVSDPGTAPALAHLGGRAVSPGDTFDVAGVAVEVFGGAHAYIYGTIPSSTNAAYILGDGAFVHGGDSYDLPGRAVDVLAVPISGPWVKLGESIGYAAAVAPRVAIPVHEAALASTDQAHGMLAAFLPDSTTVTVLERGVPTPV